MIGVLVKYKGNSLFMVRCKLLKIKNKDEVYVDGKECRKCVWSNTESGKILCTKRCRRKGDKI